MDANYAAAMRRDGLKGARLGVLHQAYDTPTLDREVVAVFRGALGELRNLGAEVIDPVRSRGSTRCARAQAGGCNQFKYDLNRYLAGLGDKAPMQSLDEIIKSRQFHPSIQVRLESGQATETSRASRRAAAPRGVSRGAARRRAEGDGPAGSTRCLPDLEQSAAPDRRSQHAGRRQQPGLRASTGFPAITVPMGYTRGGTLPAGLQIFGRPWSEATLIRFAYAYEQATHHRRPPRCGSCPALW